MNKFDYCDLQFNSSTEYLEEWNEVLDEFKQRQKKVGKKIVKKLTSFAAKNAKNGIFKNRRTYNKAWIDMEVLIQHSDLKAVK